MYIYIHKIICIYNYIYICKSYKYSNNDIRRYLLVQQQSLQPTKKVSVFVRYLWCRETHESTCQRSFPSRSTGRTSRCHQTPCKMFGDVWRIIDLSSSCIPNMFDISMWIITLIFWCWSSISCVHVIVLEFRALGEKMSKCCQYCPIFSLCPFLDLSFEISATAATEGCGRNPVLEAENSKITAAWGPSRQWPPPSALGPQHLRGLSVSTRFNEFSANQVLPEPSNGWKLLIFVTSVIPGTPWKLYAHLKKTNSTETKESKL